MRIKKFIKKHIFRISGTNFVVDYELCHKNCIYKTIRVYILRGKRFIQQYTFFVVVSRIGCWTSNHV